MFKILHDHYKFHLFDLLESGIGNLTQAETDRQKSKNMSEMLCIDHILYVNLHHSLKKNFRCKVLKVV